MCSKHTSTQADEELRAEGAESSESPQSDEAASDDGNGRRRLLQAAGAGAAATSLAGCADIVDDVLDDDLGDKWNRDHGFGTNPTAATNWDNYEITELVAVNNMMSMDVRSDGVVYYITRGANFGGEAEGTATVGYVDLDSGETGTALELPVSTFEEDGGQGIAFDPDFEDNGWVYIFYVPRDDDVEGDQPYMQVSRFESDGYEIDASSESEVIRIPHQRESCCHVGGYLEFGPEGYLHITTGDDTNPFESNGYAPLDEREGEFEEGEPADESYVGLDHKYFDAQRTSGNTADLRGSVLRIIPEDDGGYSVPDDNLFPPSEYEEEILDGLVRPEIYVMGLRNPYTISVDDHTGNLHIADYGPDAGAWDESRGPVGIVEFRQVCEPQNAGWPFARGFNYPYRRYDFETEEEGQPYWPQNLRNTSVNNTGLEDIPNVTPADAWYPIAWESEDGLDYAEAPAWVDLPRPGEATWQGDLPAGGAPMTGPAYRYSEDFGEGALDPYFDGKQFVMEWNAPGWIKYISYNDDGSIEFNDFLPDNDFGAPNDMAVAPDGSLLLQDYGGWGGGSAIYHIEYTG